MDPIHSRDVFKLIVGTDRCQGARPGDVPHFDVDPARRSEIYEAVQAMRKEYGLSPNPEIMKYYSPAFELIENAHSSQSWDAFDHGLRYLCGLIDCE